MELDNYLNDKTDVEKDYILIRAKMLDPEDPDAIR